jgi:ABC-type Fe3+ transport system substrate-binding protein
MMTAIRRRIVAVVAIAAGGMMLGESAGAQDWTSGAPKAWDELMTAAKKEGQVVVSACAGATESLAKAFKRDTGIDITFVRGSNAELGSRWDAEVRSGRLTSDVRLSGNSALPYAKEGYLVPIRDALLLPNVTEAANWRNGALLYLDSDNKFLPVPAEYVAGFPLVNTGLIDAGSITKWSDLMKPEFKGKIASYDPLDSAGGAVAMYIAKLYGTDFLLKLYKDQEIVLSRDRRQLLEWVVRGTYPIVLGADAAAEIESFRAAGITSFAALTLTDGPGNLIGGCSVTSLPKEAPHPAAARVFVNWFLSKNGQEAYVAGTRQPSDRTDVANEGVQEYLIPKPGLDYFSSYAETFVLTERPKLMGEVERAFGK